MFLTKQLSLHDTLPNNKNLKLIGDIFSGKYTNFYEKAEAGII